MDLVEGGCKWEVGSPSQRASARMPTDGLRPRMGLSSPILASRPPRPPDCASPPPEAPHGGHDGPVMFLLSRGMARAPAHALRCRPNDPRLSVVELEFTMNEVDADI